MKDQFPPKIPHPYLGYTYQDNEQNIDITHTKDSGITAQIAIFGGSVAHNFYHFNKKELLLQKSLSKALRIKHPRIVNHAAGGYKQPQQLIASILFRPNLKISVNIEGNNEIKYGLTNHFPHYYPLYEVSNLYFSGVEFWNLYVKAGKIRSDQQELKKIVSQKWWFKSFPTLLKFFYLLKERSLMNLEEDLINRKKGQKDFFKIASHPERTIYWLERSCEQQNFLAGRGIKSYFFFQPVPYVPHSKKIMTKKERQLIRGQKMKNEKFVQAFLLVRRLIREKRLSLNLVDMSQIFLNEPREIFVDDCCHLNELGHFLLTREIAKIIRNTYSESKSPGVCRDNFRRLIENLN